MSVYLYILYIPTVVGNFGVFYCNLVSWLATLLQFTIKSGLYGKLHCMSLGQAGWGAGSVRNFNRRISQIFASSIFNVVQLDKVVTFSLFTRVGAHVVLFALTG